MTRTETLYCSVKKGIQTAIPTMYVAKFQEAVAGMSPAILLDIYEVGAAPRHFSDGAGGSVSYEEPGSFSYYNNCCDVNVYIIDEDPEKVKGILTNFVTPNTTPLKLLGYGPLGGGKIYKVNYTAWWS